MKPVTHFLADFACKATFAEMPAQVRGEAVRAWVNWVGCALGGSNTDTSEAAVRGCVSFQSGGTVALLGRSEHLDLTDAALINCLTSSSQTFDDTHLKTITHPTGPVAAALLSVAHTRKVSGAELMLALVIGMEIECGIASAIAAPGSGAHGGWFMTGLAGGIGAAAAAGRLLGLNHEQMVSALGLAATQSCGLRATHGSMAIAYVPGLAARNGLSAAYMARSGFTCSDIAIDGRNGLFEVLASGANSDALVEDLYCATEFLGNSYKPYPCGIVIHPAIDACLEIAGRDGLSGDEIERVDLQVHPDAIRLTWRKLPVSVFDAQVSLYHWVAAALVFGRAGLEEGELAAVMHPAVRSLQERTFVETLTSLGSDAAIVEVRTRQGQIHRAAVEHATGSAARPMTDAQLDAKFVALATRVLEPARVTGILTACRQIEECGDVTRISQLGAL
ncbi:MmgE/PrpD family protein [Paraburkholderia caffeinilytica]|uniref:MmgE/PrpD family protein n=1 Tax=Paraburkholderia caffeinilytica TaxID=1761016 RepID=UPI0038BB1877